MTNPYQVYPPPAPQDASGLPDSYWVSRVRAGLRDQPRTGGWTWTGDGTNGVIAPGANPITAPQSPLNDNSIEVSLNGVTQTVIFTGTPTGNQVFCNLDTGEFTFASAPPTGQVVKVSCQYVKWRTTDIMEALYAGLRAMFPSVAKTYVDETISINVLQWDYLLPTWAQDPRARVIKMEVQDPYIQVVPYKPYQNWEMIGVGKVFIPESQRFSPVAKLRLTGWGPYLTLGDLEPQLFELPVLYALSVLLPKQETFRIRESTAVPLSQEGGQQPGILTQTGDYFSKRFEIELQRLARVPGPGWAVPIRSTIDRRRIY